MKRILSALAVAAFTISLSSVASANVFKKCASCHGKDGKGATKMGKKLSVRDLTDAKVQASFTDDELVKAIKEGVKNDAGKLVMKGDKGKFSDADVKELVKITRAFKGK